MTTLHSPGLFRNRDFSLLLSGQLISAIGNQAESMALPLIVLALTGSVTQAGFVLGLGTLTFLVFGLVAGALVDRWDRKATMIWCELGRTVLAGGVAVALWLDKLTMPQLYATTVLAGILTTLFQVANTAALPNVVGQRQLSAALGYSQSAGSAVGVFGASLAGALYAAGRTVPFAVNAVSFAVSAASLRLMRARFQLDRQDARTSRLTAEIREGLGWLWRQPVIRFLTLVSAADKVRYGAGYLLIITLARQLGASSLWIGVIFSGAAVGALAGALVADWAARRFPLGRIAVVMLWLEALMFPLYALAPDPLLLAAVAAAESLVAPVYAVAMTAHQLAITPDELRGRTTSAVSTLTTGALSIGALASGALISTLGAKPLVWLCGAWLLVLALLTAANRTVRQAPPAGATPQQKATGTAETADVAG
ncbi:putative MFS family arabinose efflux permease [Streptomyces sp. Ag109_O5-1]|uniref:MFS transporter n=1 Tax=Streptomyces sp. Ag109_O5-1 TaxID=1938851 RepID=UPI000F4DC1B8|nr:MFS transporter [Streptomyces sp. Ag109_O5-1]RPE37356.1 putative MFS family arabinose efflux permease [Streptomyces sp. Ag109_O5-1]